MPGAAASEGLKSIGKSYVLLLVFLCAIYLKPANAIPITASGQRLIYHTSQYRQRYHQQLLQEQRSLALPTPHHHHLHHRSVIMPETRSALLRSAENPNSVDGGGDARSQFDCQAVTKVLELALIQANTSFDTIKSILEDYIRILYQKQDIDQVHTDWQKHKLHLKHDLNGFLPANFLEAPSVSHLNAAPLSKQLIIAEMHRVYSTLKTLEKAFNNVIKDHKQKEGQIKHELGIMLLSEHHNKELTANDLYEKLEDFFDKLLENVRFNANAAKDAMRKLGIPPPPPPYPVSETLPLGSRREPRDWLLIEEFLGVMQYMRAIYSDIRARCQGGASQ